MILCDAVPRNRLHLTCINLFYCLAITCRLCMGFVGSGCNYSTVHSESKHSTVQHEILEYCISIGRAGVRAKVA